MTGRFIGKTYTEYWREFVEHFPYGKQIGKMLDIQNMQKRPQAPKPILVGLESGKSENQIIDFEFFGNYIKNVPNKKCAEWIIHFSKRAREVPN